MTRQVVVSLPGRIGYVTGTVNGEGHVFTRTTSGAWGTQARRAVSDIYRLELTAIDDAGVAGHYGATVYYGAQLITDRTQRDVEEGTAKGFYNASDLNRVGYATRFLAQRLREAGYPVAVAPKLDWSVGDIPTAGQLAGYLADVRAVGQGFYGDVPLPRDLEHLDFDGANRLEQALAQVAGHLDHMQAALYSAGELYGGEL